MSRPTTAREALIAEALGDIAKLVDRVEALVTSLDRTQLAVTEASVALRTEVDALDERLKAAAESAKKKAVEHLAHHAREVARRTTALQVQAMSRAARTLFATELDPVTRRLSSTLVVLAERLDGRRERWLVLAAAAATTCVATWAVAWVVLT